MASIVTKPAQILREELAKIPRYVDTKLIEVVFSGNGSILTFTLPSGLKPYAVYVDGMRKLAASYSVTKDINTYSVVFVAAPASGTNNIQIDCTRELA